MCGGFPLRLDGISHKRFIWQSFRFLIFNVLLRLFCVSQRVFIVHKWTDYLKSNDWPKREEPMEIEPRCVTRMCCLKNRVHFKWIVAFHYLALVASSRLTHACLCECVFCQGLRPTWIVMLASNMPQTIHFNLTLLFFELTVWFM